MTARSRAREVAFQVLYQDDMNPRGNPAFGDLLIEERLGKSNLAKFARGLVSGVRKHRQEIDALLEQSAENWQLSRMSSTDRNVLRLGTYELFHGDAPPQVVIDEAVELAKRFGAEQSSKFVNGILDKLMHNKEVAGG